jgi:hypothetical protein
MMIPPYVAIDSRVVKPSSEVRRAEAVGLGLAERHVGALQEPQHRIVERHDQDDPDDDREHAADDAAAKLAEVLRERHPIVG